MKRGFFLSMLLLLLSGVAMAQGKYAGTKKSLIGKTYTEMPKLPGLKGWEFLEGSMLNYITDPERITVDIYKRGTDRIIIGSIMEDTATGIYKVIDVVEVKGVMEGWSIRTGSCRQNKKASTYIIAWGKDVIAEFMNLIKSAWKFNPDKRRFEVMPVKGIDCENIGC
ncbi:MAG: hypothetical protein IPP02_13900 [Chitinophagaceae bacterium]|jgi:hypothetical protein|nr:hypothetical protein [Chitinophagaceae bacterium]MBK8300610.1 hypothetical protein [Chitinophagaceae bacterium]MBK9660907.1 hypothetical protein [Chitinophagaceae bacterium]MBK9939444.1 hypothetical protein [Chitinophagaceae bacterium]MBL0070209.1 hypothetical protein [Chitinophagaceae bacterium]